MTLNDGPSTVNCEETGAMALGFSKEFSPFGSVPVKATTSKVGFNLAFDGKPEIAIANG